MTVRRRCLLVLAVLGCVCPVSGQEVWAGVWKLSLEKSPKAPGRPQSQVITLKSGDGMAVMTEDNVTAKGLQYQVTCRMALDGKDYPMTGSIAGITHVSGTMLAPDSFTLQAKNKDGTVLGTYWTTHSADGKTRITLFWAGAEVSGPPVRMAIHERQPSGAGAGRQ